MPEVIFDTTCRACLPEEQLVLISDHENREMHRYRGLALSFLSLKPAIGRLMSVLGAECEHHMTQLQDVAEQMRMGHCFMASRVRSEVPDGIHRQHFFVIDEDMADQTLTQALAATHQSRHFHELMLNSCSTLQLHDLLQEFVRHKYSACQILEEVRNALR